MSRLPRGRDGPDVERAQLVLVTALILGVALIALVLLVNAAIYTENLATRDPDVGDEEVLAYEATVVDGVGGVVDRENANEYDTYDNVRSNVSASVEVLNGQLERTRLENGIIASMNLSAASYSQGRLIIHNDSSRNFTAEDGSTDWTLAGNVTDTRNYVATVEQDRLVLTNASNASSDGAFHVVLDGDSGDEWHAYVYENRTTNDIALAVKPGGVNAANAEEVCSVSTTNATIDFTAGTINGEECPGLNWGESIADPYTLQYANGDAANGTYEVTVNGTEDGLDIGDLLLEDSTASPRFVPAVYSVHLELTYRSPDLEYRATVRVARGEPDA
ncbi:DUF7261 family protein [Haloparvum sp. PAK95]|uniref:DUF7261 family protein n=1 Tax=Haloparvum sp. PAK95 TaxID=3418962 RepID=UPI003D2EEA80